MSLTYAKVLLSTFVAVVCDKPQLPVEQRLDLVEELWNSIEEDQQNVPISQDHIDILGQRLADLE